MNMPSVKDGNGLANLVLSALLTLLGGFVLYAYQAQSQQFREDDKAISRLEVADAYRSSENTRTEAAITSISQTMTTVLGAIQGLRDGNEAQVNALHDLQKRFDDIDAALRPLRPGPH